MESFGSFQLDHTRTLKHPMEFMQERYMRVKDNLYYIQINRVMTETNMASVQMGDKVLSAILTLSVPNFYVYL